MEAIDPYSRKTLAADANGSPSPVVDEIGDRRRKGETGDFCTAASNTEPPDHAETR